MNNIDEIRFKIKYFKSQIEKYKKLEFHLNEISSRLQSMKSEIKEKLGELGFSNSKKLLEEIKAIESETYKIDSIKYELNSITYKLGEIKGKLNYITSLIENKTNQINKINESLKILETSHSVLIELQKFLKKEAVDKIEKFINDSLEFIFLSKFNFKIEFSEKGNYVNADFLLSDFTGESKDLLESFGGGVIDAFSVIFRLVSIELQNPSNQGPIILDEVGKFISSEYQSRFSEFLKDWSKNFNRQIILISHKHETVEFANKVIKISKNSNFSEVEYV